MISTAHLLRAGALRRVPAQFGWVDRRLVREGHLRGLSAEALGLYLFLVVVADANGMSWYSDGRLCLELGLGQEALAKARAGLSAAGLVAYDSPFSQVLEVPARPPAAPARVQSRERSGAERPATAAEVRAMVQETFGRGGGR